MESRGRRKDVGVVLGAWLFEAMQWRVAVVLGQPLILMAFTWQLHRGVFGKSHPQSFPIQFLPIQVAHGWTKLNNNRLQLYNHNFIISFFLKTQKVDAT